MALSPGTRLGPYEVLSSLGAGGMGEVYRVRDPRLDRDVAVKILPDELFEGEDRIARFEREARALASLSHSNIAAVYSFEEIPGLTGATGRHILVMELLEGETLRSRLDAGPLSPRKAVDWGLQIVRGLAAAHARGVIHRDLKPENIFVTRDGVVKILDFGLARQAAPPGANLTPAPTVTAQTGPGVVLGTVGYMAPEQVRGIPCDQRADIFAFGSVLYEMLSGRRPFRRETAAETMAAILNEEPADLTPPASSRSPMPTGLERLVRHCLEKDPDERFQSARDLAFDLEALPQASGASGAAIARAAPGRTAWRVAGIAAAFAAGAGAVLVLWKPAPSVESEPVSISVASPTSAPFTTFPPAQTFFSVSPDGRNLAFVARNASGQDVLWIRPLRSLSAQPLPGTEGAAAPFWSPDSRWIGFFAERRLQKIEVSGASPLTICDAPGQYQAGTWGHSGEVLFAQLTDTAVRRVSAAGGAPVPVLRADPGRQEWSVCFPHFLPDSRHFLYVGRSSGVRQTYVRLGDVRTGVSSALLTDCSRAEYAPPAPLEPGGPRGTGFLLFVRPGNLLAQPFDPVDLRLTGEAKPVVADVMQHPFTGLGAFSVSHTGLLAYQAVTGLARLTWFDRQGHTLDSVADVGIYNNVRLSPDSRRFAVSVEDPRRGTHGLWVADVASGMLTRFTTGAGDDFFPVWSPDGRNLIFSRGTIGTPPHMYEASIDGGEPRELTARGRGAEWAQDWSSSGRFICYAEWSLERRRDIWILDLSGRLDPTPFATTQFDENEPQFSPDGHCIAFSSDESGSYEVYSLPFPGPGKKVRISGAGGSRPRWRRDGRELFFVSGDGRLMAAPVRAGACQEVGAPQALFSLDPAGWRDYDLSADGTRFLVVVNAGEQRSSYISLTTNWIRELAERR